MDQSKDCNYFQFKYSPSWICLVKLNLCFDESKTFLSSKKRLKIQDKFLRTSNLLEFFAKTLSQKFAKIAKVFAGERLSS